MPHHVENLTMALTVATKYQDWSAVGRTNQCNAVAAVGDSSVVLSCTTTSGGDLFDDNEGNEDFAVIMLVSLRHLPIPCLQGSSSSPVGLVVFSSLPLKVEQTCVASH